MKMRLNVARFVSEIFEAEETSVEEALKRREKQTNLFTRLVTEVTSSEECDDVSLDELTDCILNANGYSGGSFEEELKLENVSKGIHETKIVSFVNRVV